jgi:hypothetical protein
MLTRMTIRFRPATEYQVVYAAPCLKSTPHRPAYTPRTPTAPARAISTALTLQRCIPFCGLSAVTVWLRRHSIPIHPPR